MKKNKLEIILIFGMILCGMISLYFYNESKAIITTDEINYHENGGVNYKVYLSDKKYYNREYLDEGMQYISSIIDNIELKYRYNVKYNSNDTFDVTTRVLADVKIVDTDNNDKVIYSKQESIKEEKTSGKDIVIDDTIKVDYKKYNALTNSFKTSYGINAKCRLVVYYYIQYQNNGGNIRQNKVMTVEVPLSQQMISIVKSNDMNNSLTYTLQTNEGSINVLMLVLSFIFLAITLILLATLFKTFIKKKSLESKYDRYINKILRQYDSYITESSDTSVDVNKNVIKVNSFKELLDVRNNVEKAIVYIKLDENTSKFVLIDNEIYEYVVMRSEMDK